MRALIHFGWLALIPCASACSCIGQNISCIQAKLSTAVFTGRVLSAVKGPVSTKYTFQVTADFAGVSAREIEVVSLNLSASCGYNFSTGVEYLVYATRHNGELKTGACVGNKPVLDAGPDLRYLRNATQALSAGEPAAGLVYGRVTNRERDLQSFGRLSWPVEGVRVVAIAGAVIVAETHTARDGTYEFLNLVPGDYRIEAPAGSRFKTKQNSSVRMQAGRCEEVSFFNTSAAVLEGHLLDSDGEPDESTDVILEPAASKPTTLPGVDSELETDTKEGRFRFEVPSGRYRLGFRELGYVAAVYYPLELELSEHFVTRIDFRLPRRPIQTLRGFVIDLDGKPIEGVTVRISARGEDGSNIFASMTTSTDGSFLFESKVLDHEVSARVPACGDKDTARLSVSRAHAEQLTLVVPVKAGACRN
jgi:hypothetical protein